MINDSEVYNVLTQMMDAVGKKVIAESKVTAAKAALSDLLKDIKKVAEDELRRWNKELTAAGIDIKSDDNKYKIIDNVKKDVDKWVKDIVKDFTNTLNSKIINELSKCDNPTQLEITNKINTVLKDEHPKINAKLKEKLQKAYKQFLGEHKLSAKEIEQLSFNGISFDDLKTVVEPVKNILFGVLDALKSSGLQSILTGAAGGGLLVSLSTIGDIAIIGGALSTIASIAGFALLGVAFVPLIPAIADGIKKYTKRSKEERENDLKNMVANGFKDKIQPGLENSMLEVCENYYNSIISMIDKTNGKKEQNYKVVEDVIDSVTQTIDSINKNF